MSASQSPSTLESRLDSLQCHFTWNLDLTKSRFFWLQYILEDIGTEEGNSWLGHIYNLRGFIQYELGSSQEAQRLFTQAAEGFQQAEEGPWLVVNYGNLAWLHHHLGEEEESQDYLSKVDALISTYPPPPEDDLHPEILAEKAWTLMNFGPDKRKQVEDCFQRAIKMKPERVEWNTSYVLALMNNGCGHGSRISDDTFEKMRHATEQDPHNLYLAVRILEERGKRGEKVEEEVRKLTREILENPVSSYSGLKAALRVHKNYLSVDEAIRVAEEALERYPDVRYLKKSAALCYKWKIVESQDIRPNQTQIERDREIDRAIRLHQEVIDLYPHTSLVKKIDLANIHAVSSQDEAERIYQELLKQKDLGPEEKQMLYNNYARFLYFHKSLQYHKKAAEIPHQSKFRDGSINVLKKASSRSKGQIKEELEEFLANLTNVAQIPSTLESRLESLHKIAQSNQTEAERIYQELLQQEDLGPEDKQMLYNNYARFLYFQKEQPCLSLQYHKKAAEIPHQSKFRDGSIKELKKARDRSTGQTKEELEEFLANLTK